MKPLRFFILLTFAFVSIASATLFFREKAKTDTTIPVITVEGDVIEVSLKATDEELLKGVTAYDEKDGVLTKEIVIESISKFTEKGVSKVTYAVCDSNNNIAKATRKIKYKDYKSPRFKVTGNMCFSLYERIDISKMVKAIDSIDGDITNELVMTLSNFSNSSTGSYIVNVSVINSKGDSSEIELPLIVEDRVASVPTINLKEYLIYVKKGQTADFKSYIIDAKDNFENDLTENVQIEAAVDFNKEGTYHVHYYVTDESEQRGHSIMTVIVGD